MSAVDLWQASFREVAASLPGSGVPWLARLRAQAIERFADEGWPSNRLERWRHTSLVFMNNERFTLSAQAADEAAGRQALAVLQAVGGAAAAGEACPGVGDH